MKIKVSPFGLRQIGVTATSGKFGGWTKSAIELEKLVESHSNEFIDGNRPYVKILNLKLGQFELGDFLCTHADVTDNDQVIIKMESRRTGEIEVPVTYCHASRAKASYVSIIMYSTEELIKEGSQVTGDSDYEIVSINSKVSEVNEPQNPWSMLRNWFSSNPNDLRGIGGSPYLNKDPNEFISELYESMQYWARKARVD